MYVIPATLLEDYCVDSALLQVYNLHRYIYIFVSEKKKIFFNSNNKLEEKQLYRWRHEAAPLRHQPSDTAALAYHFHPFHVLQFKAPGRASPTPLSETTPTTANTQLSPIKTRHASIIPKFAPQILLLHSFNSHPISYPTIHG